MRLKIDKVTIYLLSVYVFNMVAIIGASVLMGSSQQGYLAIGCLSCIHVVCALLLLRRAEGTIITISGIFVIFLYVFHMGQFFLNVFCPNYVYAKTNFLELVGAEKFFYSSVFSMAIITTIVIGIIWGNGFKTNQVVHTFLSKYRRRSLSYEFDKRKMIVVGWFLLFTTAPFHIRAAYGQILLTSSGNYFDAFEYQISGTMYAYTQFMLVGITLLMLGYAEKKIKLACVYLITVAYFCWTMLSGGRGRAVIAIVFFTLLYLKLIKISLIKLVPFAIAGYVGLITLSIISVVRNEGAITLNVLLKGFENSGSPVLRALEEFGGTQYTMALTMENIPSNFQYRFGSSYLLSLASILPNVGGIFTEINNAAFFYNGYAQNYMGGSIIAEIYANFGYLFFIPAILIGIFVSKFSNAFEKAVDKKRYLLIPFMTLLFTGTMWWVRDTVSSIWRNFIWAAVYLEILFKIYDELFGRRGRNEEDSYSNWDIKNRWCRKNHC